MKSDEDCREKLKPTSPFVLFVEGDDEAGLFSKLMRIENIQDFQIVKANGKGNIENSLANFRRESDFSIVRRLGIVRDADQHGASSAFQSISSILQKEGLPCPRSQREIGKSAELWVGTYIMPDNQSSGMLEDLCLQSVQGSVVSTCVDSFIECIVPRLTPDEQAKFNPAKAKVQAYLSTRVPLQNSIGRAAQSRHWDFSHPCFDGIKLFLKELFT